MSSPPPPSPPSPPPLDHEPLNLDALRRELQALREDALKEGDEMNQRKRAFDEVDGPDEDEEWDECEAVLEEEEEEDDKEEEETEETEEEEEKEPPPPLPPPPPLGYGRIEIDKTFVRYFLKESSAPSDPPVFKDELGQTDFGIKSLVQNFWSRAKNELWDLEVSVAKAESNERADFFLAALLEERGENGFKNLVFEGLAGQAFGRFCDAVDELQTVRIRGGLAAECKDQGWLPKLNSLHLTKGSPCFPTPLEELVFLDQDPSLELAKECEAKKVGVMCSPSPLSLAPWLELAEELRLGGCSLVEWQSGERARQRFSVYNSYEGSDPLELDRLLHEKIPPLQTRVLELVECVGLETVDFEELARECPKLWRLMLSKCGSEVAERAKRVKGVDVEAFA